MSSTPPPPFESIRTLQNHLASGELTARGLLERCLQTIDARDSEIHAWVHVDRDGAIEQADMLDRERRDGHVCGLLHGIPVGIKDIIDVAGLPTRGGCPSGRDQPVLEDACVTARLREAGAIILGKTVTTQYAGFDPPVTRNPHALDRTPGGSSSGSAAAVAAGMCPIAIGSQTGGSITRPASFCGVAGCKPSMGRVSRRGVIPLADSLDHVGPMAGHVDDLAIVLDVICGPDASTRSTLATRISSQQTAIAGRTFQWGLLGGPFLDWAEPVMQAALHRSIERMAGDPGNGSRAELNSIDWPTEGETLWDIHYDIMAYETGAVHGEEFDRQPEAFLPKFTSLIEHGRTVSPSRYAEARNHQETFRTIATAMFESAEVLVCAGALGPAPDAGTTGNPSFNSPWSYLGWPTVSFPIDRDENGLPLAIQLVGPPNGEEMVFRLARACERNLRR